MQPSTIEIEDRAAISKFALRFAAIPTLARRPVIALPARQADIHVLRKFLVIRGLYSRRIPVLLPAAPSGLVELFQLVDAAAGGRITW